MDHTAPKVRAALFAFQILSLQRDFYHLWSLINVHQQFRADCLLSVHLLRFCVCLGFVVVVVVFVVVFCFVFSSGQVSFTWRIIFYIFNEAFQSFTAVHIVCTWHRSSANNRSWNADWSWKYLSFPLCLLQCVSMATESYKKVLSKYIACVLIL